MTVFNQLLNDYKHCLIRGDHSDGAAAYLALVDEYEQAARRAPAAPVPQGVVEPIDTVKYWRDAYANPQGDEHFMGHGMVVKIFDDYLGMLAAAPQPPEAEECPSCRTGSPYSCTCPFKTHRNSDLSNFAESAVKLPEPVAFALEWTFDGEERGIRLYDDERHCRFDAESDGGVCSPLYTEQQVRDLLAAHGIGKDKA